MNDAPDTPTEVCEVYRSRRDALLRGARARRLVVRRGPRGTMFAWAPVPEAFAPMGSLRFAEHLAREAKVAVSPGVGFGPGGEGFVRFALVENEHRIRQAVRGIGRVLRDGPPA